MLDHQLLPRTFFKGAEEVILKIKMFATENINDMISGFIVNDHLGNPVFGANTDLYSKLSLQFEKNQEYVVSYKFTLPLLRNGIFTISPAIAEGTQSEHIQHHWIHDALSFTVNTMDTRAKMGWLFSIDQILIEVE